MPFKIAYPWFFFFRIARLSLLVFLISVMSLLYFARTSHKEILDDRAPPLSSIEIQSELNLGTQKLILRIVPLSILLYCLFIALLYWSTKPLGVVLARIQKFKDEIPFDRTLKLLYQKDEWAQIEEALNKADRKIQEQVSKVKMENEKISAILESIHDGIIAIDNFETVLFYNSNFKREFMNKRSSGDIMPKLWHTFEDDAILSAFKKVLSTGKAEHLKTLSFLSTARPERFFDLTITPLHKEEGKITGALGVFYDITEFKLTEQMRVDFVANVSHEIRTPLTSIKGYTQLLQTQKNKLEPDYQLFLERIITNTERMISLFNDLLSLSVIESKDLVKFETLNLPALISSVSESIATNYAGKEMAIELDLRLESIRGDQRLMEQVLSNLIDNACKYSDDSISIKISTLQKDDKALIIVADNGPGISKEHLQRIFERFYRIDSSRESRRGTGLGLSIVKHIVAKHGGRIWAESEQQVGTTFMIELPLE